MSEIPKTPARREAEDFLATHFSKGHMETAMQALDYYDSRIRYYEHEDNLKKIEEKYHVGI